MSAEDEHENILFLIIHLHPVVIIVLNTIQGIDSSQ